MKKPVYKPVSYTHLTSMVLGDKEHVIYGKGYIEDEL